MPHSAITQNVRLLVGQTFAQLGVHEPNDFRESILVRGNAYCGRKFEAQGGHAHWFVEENEVKFYDQSGRLVVVLAADQEASDLMIATTRRLAA